MRVADHHNQQWRGSAQYRFDERVNSSDLFESQAYTSLLQVGPREVLVTYNKYFDKLFDGEDGCWHPSFGNNDSFTYCSVGFGMRFAVNVTNHSVAAAAASVVHVK
jgi:hypothetical protein